MFVRSIQSRIAETQCHGFRREDRNRGAKYSASVRGYDRCRWETKKILPTPIFWIFDFVRVFPRVWDFVRGPQHHRHTSRGRCRRFCSSKMDRLLHIPGPVGVGPVFIPYIFCPRFSILSAFSADPRTKSSRQTTLRFFSKKWELETSIFFLEHLDQLFTWFEAR